MNASASTRSKTLSLTAAALLVLAAAWVTMWPLSHASNTNWDDSHTVFENPELLPPTFRSLVHLWEKPRADLYVPMTYTYWWAIAHVAAGAPNPADPDEPTLRPAPFHIANIAVHTATSVLVLLLLSRLVPSIAAACAGALIFAVHPVQVETVGWISGGKDALCGLLSVAAILSYVVYAQRAAPADETRSTRATGAFWWAAVVLMILAILAKPVAIMLPWICFAIDRLVLRVHSKRSIRDFIPMMLASLPFIVIAQNAQPAELNTHVVTPLLRPLVAFDAIAFYMTKIGWPARLTIDYARHPQAILASGAIWWTWLLPAAVAATAIAIYRKTHRVPISVIGLIVAVLATLPVLGLATFDFQLYSTVADHYLYLPMVGIGLFVAAIFAALSTAVGSLAVTRWSPAVVLALVVVALGIRASRQTAVWQSSMSLSMHQIESTPKSFLGFNNVVAPLLEKGQIALAKTAAEKSIELFPENAIGWMNLGLIELEVRDSKKAIEAFERSAKFASQYGGAIPQRIDLAYAYGQAGRYDEAIEQYHLVLLADPNNRLAKRLLPQTTGWRNHLRASSEPTTAGSTTSRAISSRPTTR